MTRIFFPAVCALLLALVSSPMIAADISGAYVSLDGKAVVYAHSSIMNKKDGRIAHVITFQQLLANDFEGEKKPFGTHSRNRMGIILEGIAGVDISGIREGPQGETLVVGSAFIPQEGAGRIDRAAFDDGEGPDIGTDFFAIMLDANGRPDPNFFENGFLHIPMDHAFVHASAFMDDGSFVAAIQDRGFEHSDLKIIRILKDAETGKWRDSRDTPSRGVLHLELSDVLKAHGYKFEGQLAFNVTQVVQTPSNGLAVVGIMQDIMAGGGSSLPRVFVAEYMRNRWVLKHFAAFRSLNVTLDTFVNYDPHENIFTLYTSEFLPIENHSRGFASRERIVVTAVRQHAQTGEYLPMSRDTEFQQLKPVSGPEKKLAYFLGRGPKGDMRIVTVEPASGFMTTAHFPSKIKHCQGAFANFLSDTITLSQSY